MKREIRCASMGCEKLAEYCETDRFNVSGIDSVSFFYVCEEHMRVGLNHKPCPGHEPRTIRRLNLY